MVAALSMMVVAALAGVAMGGPLDPTAPPGSTGKNVITALPVAIDESGSYVLNGNLVCTACDSDDSGITVNVSNVTIDLQGFELAGNGQSGNGIWVPTGTHNLTVRNGTIRDWGWAGIDMDAFTTGLVVDEVHFLNNVGDGLLAGNQSRITNCRVVSSQSTFGIGIGIGSGIVKGCIVHKYSGGISVGAGGAIIEDCVVTGAGGGSGIYLSDDAVVRGCNVSNNESFGIWVQGTNNTIERTQLVGNGGTGIRIDAANNTIRESEIYRTGANKDVHLTSPAIGTVMRDTTVSAQANCIQVDSGAGILAFDNSWHNAGSC
jgi:parallel beta-helix repeat protein